MAAGRRCDAGCESWPDDDRYTECPVCGERTTRYRKLRPLTRSEASHREFDVYYAAYDERSDSRRLDSDAPDASLGVARVVDVRPALLCRRAGPAS